VEAPGQSPALFVNAALSYRRRRDSGARAVWAVDAVARRKLESWSTQA